MPQFESHGLKAGIWSGILTAKVTPGRVFLTHLGEVVSVARVESVAQDQWRISVDLPSGLLADGVHSFILLTDAGDGSEAVLPDATQLDRLHVVAGAPIDDTLLAEVQLLRAELELLKREFRRLVTLD